MGPSEATALQLPLADSWVHALLTNPPAPRGAVLIMPPLLHELQRGYRLFALLADALAARGVATLRFDYRGSGESGGEDHEFLPARGVEDAQRALQELTHHAQAPTAVLAVRAGALLAMHLERAPGVRLWLWQPVVDGAAYVQQLRERDLMERNNRMRFPALVGRRAADPRQIMGFRVHPQLLAEIAAMRVGSDPALVIDAASALPSPQVGLPPELSRWVAEVDISGVFPLPLVAAVADRLASEFDRS